ncbi:MAG: sigma 54-interacting transcriptional regulator, partial [Desulfobacterales bacterium]|nr:sigma 54-interacting transcriptional regulator [Desulfobacterales bacterium]
FTGADRQRIGYFEAADSGTLFLDEVAELPLSAQVKLLRALQEEEITRLGATQPIKVNVRIISATNSLLLDEISKNRFRPDLFYRLAVAVLHLPPLRNRPGDLSLLIDKLLEQTNRESKEEPGYVHKKITPSARNLMLNHDWPGNIRELQNTILRAAVWSDGSSIGKEDIEDALIPQPDEDRSDLLNKALGDGFNLLELMKVLAQHYLKKALGEAHGNKTKAARLLGLPNYQTLSNWMKKYDIK